MRGTDGVRLICAVLVRRAHRREGCYTLAWLEIWKGGLDRGADCEYSAGEVVTFQTCPQGCTFPICTVEREETMQNVSVSARVPFLIRCDRAAGERAPLGLLATATFSIRTSSGSSAFCFCDISLSEGRESRRMCAPCSGETKTALSVKEEDGEVNERDGDALAVILQMEQRSLRRLLAQGRGKGRRLMIVT